MSTIAVTVTIPDWIVERMGNPDPVTLTRRVLEALVADFLRTRVVTLDEARRWLEFDDPGAFDAYLRARGIVAAGTEPGHGA